MVVNTIPLHGTQDQEENVEFKNRTERERKRERGLSSDNISVLINNYNWSARDIHQQEWKAWGQPWRGLRWTKEEQQLSWLVYLCKKPGQLTDSFHLLGLIYRYL